jgi:hypothetical protein
VPAAEGAHERWREVERAQQRWSESAMKRAQELWLLASRPGPGGDEEEPFLSVDEACWLMGWMCLGEVVVRSKSDDGKLMMESSEVRETSSVLTLFRRLGACGYRRRAHWSSPRFTSTLHDVNVSWSVDHLTLKIISNF